MLTYSQRKARLPFGAGSAVAEQMGCAVSNVTGVLKGAHRNRAIEKALASLMTPRTSVTEAFGAPGPERVRRKGIDRPDPLPAGPRPIEDADVGEFLQEVE